MSVAAEGSTQSVDIDQEIPYRSDIASVYDSVKELPGGQRATTNKTGMEMSTISPLHQEWVASYDGTHPLVDIGCAYGRNTYAASQVLSSTLGEPVVRASARILAVDCSEIHLSEVEKLQATGVRTAYGELPSGLPIDLIQDYGGASGILISEVFHFLSGPAIPM